jgi:hypothetical protein
MSTIPTLERVRFFPGELLTADDLTVVDGNNRELRWLHNSTMHDWGIGYGFHVQGARGDTSVTVSPGYATDVEGREIILSALFTLPSPAVPGASDGGAAIYYVVTNYVDDADETVEEQRGATACAVGGAVRLSNDPAILWKTAAQLVFGTDVILGTVSIKNCALSAKVSTAGRRTAYAVPRFSIYAAEIAVADIQWTAWKQGTVNAGYKATIDTSAAGFVATPAYTAHIVGSRSIVNTDFVAVDFISVTKQTPTGFTLQVALPSIAFSVNPAQLTDPKTGPALLKTLGWRVSWMGVEG